MVTRTDVAKMLEYGVRTGFLNGKNDYSPLRKAFCRDITSQGAFETYADLGDLPWPRLNGGVMGAGPTVGHAPSNGSNAGGGSLTSSDLEERALIVANLDFDIKIEITHNAINDNRVGGLEEKAREAGANFQKHMDYLAFQALLLGNATTYGQAYDGGAFFRSTHVDPRASYQTNQSNLNALTLSLDNFEAVKVSGSKFRDSQGNTSGYAHTLLITGVDNERRAAQITSNREDYATNNRAENPYAGKVKSLIVPGNWFSTTAWVLVDDSQTRKPVYLQVRQAPSLSVVDKEDAPDGGLRTFIWKARYNVFYGDWRLAILGNA